MVSPVSIPCRSGAYATQSVAAVRCTLHWFRWYRAFIRSSCSWAHDPEDEFRGTIARPDAQRRLTSRVLIAIGRKAGARWADFHGFGPDPPWRKLDPDYQVNLARDARRINDHFGRRVVVRESEIATPELRRRYRGRLFKDD